MSPDLLEAGIGELAVALRSRRTSPVELVEACLQVAAETEPTLHAYAVVDADGARAAARAAAAEIAGGHHRGPLHGVPVGVKDLYDTAGLVTAYGSARFARHVPQRDAAAVAALRRAGAVVVGKHTTHELAWGGRTDSAFFGPTRNPHDPARIPGGSSGGTAASVAVGSSLAGLGTDTAGSVRIPAALSGCVGFKPSRGRISLAGVMPLARSLDHGGVLARSVDDAALVFASVAGPDPADLRTLDDAVPGLERLLGAGAPGAEGGSGAPLRVGWLGGWFSAVLDPGVRALLASLRAALEAERAVQVVDVEVPVAHDLAAAVLTLVLEGAHPLHADGHARAPHLTGDDLAALLEAPPPGPRALAAARAVGWAAAGGLAAALVDCDVLLSATVPVPAPVIGAGHVEVETASGLVALPVEEVLTRLTSWVNVMGAPALSVPVGSAGGLPVGVQLVGRPLDDVGVLRAGRLVESLRPGWRRASRAAEPVA